MKSGLDIHKALFHSHILRLIPIPTPLHPSLTHSHNCKEVNEKKVNDNTIEAGVALL